MLSFPSQNVKKKKIFPTGRVYSKKTDPGDGKPTYV